MRLLVKVLRMITETITLIQMIGIVTPKMMKSMISMMIQKKDDEEPDEDSDSENEDVDENSDSEDNESENEDEDSED